MFGKPIQTRARATPFMRRLVKPVAGGLIVVLTGCGRQPAVKPEVVERFTASARAALNAGRRERAIGVSVAEEENGVVVLKVHPLVWSAVGEGRRKPGTDSIGVAEVEGLDLPRVDALIDSAALQKALTALWRKEFASVLSEPIVSREVTLRQFLEHSDGQRFTVCRNVGRRVVLAPPRWKPGAARPHQTRKPRDGI